MGKLRIKLDLSPVAIVNFIIYVIAIVLGLQAVRNQSDILVLIALVVARITFEKKVGRK